LATTDPNRDPDDGHPIAYEAILRESAKFDTPPLFVKEDSEPDDSLELGSNMWEQVRRRSLSRNLFPPRGFSPTGDSAAFNGTARQPSPVMGTCLHHPVSRR
jgi:hypothetical protein